MARVLGALLSQIAVGKIGRMLVFKRGGQYQTVIVKTPAKDPMTPPQFVIRKTYGMIQADWRTANVAIVNEYNERASGKQMSGHNLFYKETFNRVHNGVCGYSNCGISVCRST